MTGHKVSLSQFKKIEVIPSIFYNYSGMKLELINERKTGKGRDMEKLNITLLNNQCIKEEIKRAIKYLETNENRNKYKNLWDAAKVLREKFMSSNSYIKKKKATSQTTYLNLKELGKVELSPTLEGNKDQCRNK